MKKIKPNFKELNKMAIEGTLPDDLNPLFIFTRTNNKLLGDIVKGKIDLMSFAKHELENRGYNEKNEFVGFKTK